VEWAERLGDLLPPEHLDVVLVITGEEERQITLNGHGPRWAELMS
jgi:tRNA A37 threonylcarbamoyladenosine biosynthesis protein TsaE